MTSISIIGLGTYARAVGTRAIEGGHAVEFIGRDGAKAKDLADELVGEATAGTFGTAPAGDIVILAVPYASAVPVVAQCGDALAGKVIIDISNTFAADDIELVTPDGSSGAQEIAKAVPASAHVVKAFNTVFATSWPWAVRWTCSSPATTRRLKRACRRSSRVSGCARWMSAAWRWRTGSKERAC